jgi:superfamily II DNA helicase RecQ
MGINIPDIRSIIHLGWARTLLDYGQESGRAGRNGEGKEVLNAVLDFAEASRRFYSRVPVTTRTEDASQSE